MEKFLEKLMYSSRWLLAPIYLGMSLLLLAVVMKFFQEALGLLPTVWSIKDDQLILVILSLVDLTLVAGLIIMVMFSSYENFVSRLDLGEQTEKLNWLGKMDATSLKNKVAAAIVAISSIHLLKVFVNTPKTDAEHIKWYVIIHLTFVVSAFAMGILDKLTKHEKYE